MLPLHVRRVRVLGVGPGVSAGGLGVAGGAGEVAGGVVAGVVSVARVVSVGGVHCALRPGAVTQLESPVLALLGDGVHLGEEDGGEQHPACKYQGLVTRVARVGLTCRKCGTPMHDAGKKMLLKLLPGEEQVIICQDKNVHCGHISAWGRMIIILDTIDTHQ